MVEYSDILAHVKELFPEKDNSELTKMSYSIWKYGNHYCPRKSFNISKSNKLIVTHQN